MTKYRTKSLPHFLAPNDEDELSARLRSAIPGIQFIDGCKWPTPTVPYCQRISDCKTPIVYFWNSSSHPELPSRKLETGQTLGPTSGVVVQYLRSGTDGRVLLSGDIGVGIALNDEMMSDFVRKAWKVIKSMNSCSLQLYDSQTGTATGPKIRDYVVGENARTLNQLGTILKHCAADVYYRCAN